MVTFADLLDARITRLTAAAQVWQQFAGTQRRLEQQVVDDLAGPLRKGGWQGAAAEAALARITSLHDEFEVYAVKAGNLVAVLHQAAAEFHRLQQNLQAAVDAATGLGLRVTVTVRSGSTTCHRAHCRTPALWTHTSWPCATPTFTPN